MQWLHHNDRTMIRWIWGTNNPGNIQRLHYEMSFNEFCISVWNQLAANQMLHLFVNSPRCHALMFDETKCVLSTNWLKNKCKSEFSWKITMSIKFLWKVFPYFLRCYAYYAAPNICGKGQPSDEVRTQVLSAPTSSSSLAFAQTQVAIIIGTCMKYPQLHYNINWHWGYYGSPLRLVAQMVWTCAVCLVLYNTSHRPSDTRH